MVLNGIGIQAATRYQLGLVLDGDGHTQAESATGSACSPVLPRSGALRSMSRCSALSLHLSFLFLKVVVQYSALAPFSKRRRLNLKQQPLSHDKLS